MDSRLLTGDEATEEERLQVAPAVGHEMYDYHVVGDSVDDAVGLEKNLSEIRGHPRRQFARTGAPIRHFRDAVSCLKEPIENVYCAFGGVVIRDPAGDLFDVAPSCQREVDPLAHDSMALNTVCALSFWIRRSRRRSATSDSG